MPINPSSEKAAPLTAKRHKTVAYERGTFGDQGQLKGYAASCETCDAVTFGGFASKTLAKAALEHTAVTA